MRDSVIVEIAVREIATHCGFADMAYGGIDRSGGQEAERTFFAIHAFLGYYRTVSQLLRSKEIARHTGGQTLEALLGMPPHYQVDNNTVRHVAFAYDVHLARKLAGRGGVEKVLDGNTGDRDAFEEEGTFFVSHYDPTVDTLTILEEEINLARISAELADIKDHAEAWLGMHAALMPRPASVSIPPST